MQVVVLPQIPTCCFCLDRKAGSIGIGIFYLVASAVAIILLPQFAAAEQYSSVNGTVRFELFVKIGLSTNIVCFLLALLLIIGVYKNFLWSIFPLLIYIVLEQISTAVTCILLLLHVSEAPVPVIIIVLVLFVLAILKIYFIYNLQAYYKLAKRQQMMTLGASARKMEPLLSHQMLPATNLD
ncbi:lysosomal-associated transmembrane protein 4B-like [Corticium candelabrum]|uniref:lysosomal-associated transmembrane protein 4B-like n=1 Tax=Corticium candelabrum TaxID=121492 RepID=UPI002E264ABE|nr:lysosomal-associated transmembrane protein 4B-like [Corticium candelabrum]